MGFRACVTERIARTYGALRTLPPKFYLLLGYLVFMLPLSVSFGDDKASLQVINRTAYFVHLIVNGEAILYIGPGNTATRDSETSTFDVKAFYAPGQGVSGRADRVLEAPYYPGSVGCEESSRGGCECVTNPSDYGSVTWEITHDTLTVDPGDTLKFNGI